MRFHRGLSPECNVPDDSDRRERDMAYPTNVLHLATECGNKRHSAAFPSELPEWFIKLFTQPGDTVLDPFMGSGTTIHKAAAMQRNAIGVEISSEYCDIVEAELLKDQQVLFERKAPYASP